MSSVSVLGSGRTRHAEVVIEVGGETARPFNLDVNASVGGEWQVCGQSYEESDQILASLESVSLGSFERSDQAPIDASSVDWRQSGWGPDASDRLNWGRAGSTFDVQRVVMRVETTVWGSEEAQRQARRDFLSIPGIVAGAVEQLDVPSGCLGVRWAGLTGGMIQPPDRGRFEEYVHCEWDTNTLLIQIVALGRRSSALHRRQHA